MHWKVTVFRNFINPFAEEDVQHVYIKQMSMRDEKPVVIVEDGRVFGVDLKTRAVKRLKQAPPEESQANPVSAVNGGMPILSRSGRIRLAATDLCCSAAITHNEDDEIKHL